MPWGQKTKTKNRSNVVANSIKALKWSTSTLKKKKEEEAVEKNSDAEYFGENMSH